LAQRLARVLCPHCKVAQSVRENELRASLGLPIIDEAQNKEHAVFKAQGCSKCMHTGFSGRIGIFELLGMSDEVSKAIINRASSEDIKKIAFVSAPTLLEDGLYKIIQGQTTIDEVLRVVSS